MSDIKLLESCPIAKSDQNDLANRIIHPVLEGDVSPVEAVVKAKSLIEVLTKFVNDDRIKDCTLSEIEKNGKEATWNGARLTIKEVGIKYDYTDCNDPVYTELLDQKKILDKQLKVMIDMKQQNRLYLIIYVAALLMLSGQLITGCSSTSALKEDEQLFTGLVPIEYKNYEKGAYADSTIAEMEYALASAPNGALFGSSYYRTPFPVRLWIWNAFSQSDGAMAKWITKVFGSKPKLMANVNPQLRAQVAEHQLDKYGYFNGKVTYDVLTQSNPKKAKVAYHVDFGHLWTLDSMAYLNFPAKSKQLIDASMAKALIRKGSPFNVSNMESERQRITRLFRNRGYYFYQNSYASYLADTVNVPGKVQLRLMMADSVDDRATRQWYIGKINVNFRKQYMEELKDSFVRSYLSFHYNGRKMPIRPGIVLQSLRLRPRELYRVRTEERAKTGLQEMGLFSYSSIQFTPRSVQTLDSLGNVVYRDTLDANIDLVFDKPYDFYVEANARGKTTGRVGPELVVGLTKRNAFHGGEKLSVNLHGSHEWQTISQAGGGSTRINSYEYGSDVSVEFPRIITPWNMFRTMEQNERRYRAGHMPTRYRGVPTTTIKASMNVLNRASYFRRHVASGELTYAWSTSYQHQHSFSPLILSYEFMNSRTAAFDSILALHPYLQISMRDQFVPKMSYTYTYRSPRRYRHPITWSTTISEAANILSLGYMAAGKGWNEKDKKMFKNPFAQFLKLETDFVKYWRITQDGTLVGHVNAGIIWSYGNAENAPYYEQFYIGGANSVRAFNVRSIGPGRYQPTNSKYSYIDQTGDIKYLMNLEYRQKVWGDLYGALFLDAGNVWTLRNHEYSPLGKFDVDKFFRQLAVGTGVGVRYDMGMFVIRVDWGIGLHVPYDTGKNGIYNIRRFKDAQSLHFAVGYPF